ncbi:hypothetical protein I7V28_01550 [Lelliottia amnigena]|uniref:hypothetical protein n=1 Tax=Lelliottia amnigena TaxID=61646 RepID=UPI00192AA082|nr:hypothetical protein [Lelliottia amnigena]MBL5919819.1 hypothetical protein [Lelliottia amnigena]
MESEDIINISKTWLENIVQDDGVILINPSDESFRLRNNSVIIHELDFKRLMACIASTSITLAIPSQSGGIAPNVTMVDKDHENVWGWCAEFVKFLRICSRSHFVEPFMDLFLTCSYAACMPTVRRHGFITKYLDDSHLHLSYLAMPLLEGVAKSFCAEFVAMNGDVKKPFKKLKGEYYKENKRCSSIGDLLLLVEEIADSDLKQDIIRLNGIVESYNPGYMAYETIRDWRNSSLHGSQSYRTIAGITLNYSLVIIMNKIKLNYDENRLDCIEHLNFLAERDGCHEFMYIPRDHE